MLALQHFAMRLTATPRHILAVEGVLLAKKRNDRCARGSITGQTAVGFSCLTVLSSGKIVRTRAWEEEIVEGKGRSRGFRSRASAQPRRKPG